MNTRQVTGNATHRAVTKPSTLLINEKLTLQLFGLGGQGLPSCLWEHLRVTLIAAGPALPGYLLLRSLTEADASSELAGGRVLALPREECSRENGVVQERCGLGSHADLACALLYHLGAM